MKKKYVVLGLPALLIPVILLCGCRGCLRATRQYNGVVLDAETHLPLPGVEVRCGHVHYGKFAPSMDGLFLRRSAHWTVTTDGDGRFGVAMSGFDRQIQVIHYPHRRWRADVTDWPRGKDVVIMLERDRLDPKPKEE